MENKQTSAEWLFKQLWETPKDKFTWYAILEQAKAMEKQQIIDAIRKTEIEIVGHYNDGDAEYYYNETFNK